MIFLIVLLTSQITQVDLHACGMNEKSQSLALIIKNSQQQTRNKLTCNESLSKIAQRRAQELSVDTHGKHLTANHFVTKNGYRLASYYPLIENQVESLTSFSEDPEKAFIDFTSNPKYQEHILGIGEFYQQQTQIGVGFYRTENNRYQYVVLIAEPYSPPKIIYKVEPKDPEYLQEKKCNKNWKRTLHEKLRKVCKEMERRELAKRKQETSQ